MTAQPHPEDRAVDSDLVDTAAEAHPSRTTAGAVDRAQLAEHYARRGQRIVELAREDPVLGPTIAAVEAQLGSGALRMGLGMMGITMPGSLDEANPAVVAIYVQAVARLWTASAE